MNARLLLPNEFFVAPIGVDALGELRHLVAHENQFSTDGPNLGISEVLNQRTDRHGVQGLTCVGKYEDFFFAGGS